MGSTLLGGQDAGEHSSTVRLFGHPGAIAQHPRHVGTGRAVDASDSQLNTGLVFSAGRCMKLTMVEWLLQARRLKMGLCTQLLPGLHTTAP